MWITLFRSLRDVRGERISTSWDGVIKMAEDPIEGECEKIRLPGWSFATFANDVRRLDNVEQVCALALDYDDGTDFDTTVAHWVGAAACIHTTVSHEPRAPRLRVILPLSRPCSADEYSAVWEFVNAYTSNFGVDVDANARDASRFFFRPCYTPVYRTATLQGVLLNVDSIFEKHERLIEAPSVDLETLSPFDVGNPLERAKAFLNAVPGAVQGESGDWRTYDTACALVRGFGLWEGDALELMLTVYNPKCVPMWSVSDLKYKVRRAVNAARRPWGYKLGRRST